jgi:cytochrome b
MADAPPAVASLHATTETPVWDPLVRLSHWTLAIGFFVAYFSEDILSLHVWAGYAVGVVVVLRIVWGFVGPEHARFSDFLYRPSEVASYLRDLLLLRAKRYLGHSPAGGAMVLVLLIGLAVTVGSGLLVYAIEDNGGPLAGIVVGAGRPEGAAGTVPGQRDAEEESGEGFGARRAAGSMWEEVHEVVANLTLFLVCLHVAGVLLASFVHQENLARAMVTGRKRPL